MHPPQIVEEFYSSPEGTDVEDGGFRRETRRCFLLLFPLVKELNNRNLPMIKR